MSHLDEAFKLFTWSLKLTLPDAESVRNGYNFLLQFSGLAVFLQGHPTPEMSSKSYTLLI